VGPEYADDTSKEVLTDHRQPAGEPEPPPPRFRSREDPGAPAFAAGRAAPTMGSMIPTRRRFVATVALAVALALAASACVGKTGRNDDDVAPGSGGGPSGNVVPHDD
jgi:hypothetical protein